MTSLGRLSEDLRTMQVDGHGPDLAVLCIVQDLDDAIQLVNFRDLFRGHECGRVYVLTQCAAPALHDADAVVLSRLRDAKWYRANQPSWARGSDGECSFVLTTNVIALVV